LSLDSVFTVSSLGAGPGLYFDFAAFIFQVPDIWSADSTATLRATSRSAAAKTATCLVRMNTSSNRLYALPGRSVKNDVASAVRFGLSFDGPQVWRSATVTRAPSAS